MTTHLHLRCGGCFAETHTAPIRRTFVSFNGLGHGYGRHQEPDIDKAVEPTGWIWSDPYTGCTYCPECWKEIEAAPQESGSSGSAL